MKKKLSLLVALVTMITSLMTPFHLNSGAASFSDVNETNPYQEAIVTLNKLKVINGYEDGTFGPDKSITRAEFTKLIVYMLGYGGLSDKITRFEDLSTDHWANANICVAYNLGIVNGFSDTEFGPDAPVTYEQALKMVVCTLGYQNDADANGGYPEGYRAEANSLKLNKGISGIGYTDNAPRGVVAQIMYNALEVPIRENNGSNKWETTDKTILNDYLNVYKLKGTVVGVEESITSNCDAGTLSPGYFAIDEDRTNEEYVIDYTEYTSSLSEMTAYLGKTIQIYYRTDNLSIDKWLVEIDNETYTNKELTISSYDLYDYSNYTIKYYTEGSGKASTIRLDAEDLTIRYNGRVVPDYVTIGDNMYSSEEALTQWFDDNSENKIYGNVRIIDSGSTGKYNIIDIYDYETIVPNSVPVSPDYRIIDKTKTGYTLTLNPDAADYKFTMTKNGTDYETTSLSSGDVVSYALNLDGDYYTVLVCSETVSGTITSLNINDKDKTVSINNKEYHVSDRFLDYIANKDKTTLETGASITAHVDAFGTLEWGTITKTTTFYPYAYVVNAEGEGEDYYLQLYAPTNTSATSFTSSTAYSVKKYKIQDTNPKLNSKKSSPESIIAALEANAELPDADIANITVKGTGYNQLIKVGFNSSGQIENVILLNSDKDGETNEDNGSLYRFRRMDPTTKYYVTSSSVKETNKSTGSTAYSIKSTTPLFVIPKDRTDTNAYSLKSAISTNSMISGSTYYLDAYDLSSTKYPNVLLVYNSTMKSGTAITYTTAYRLVGKNIDEEYDESSGDIFSMLYTYNSATTVTKTKIAPDYKNVFTRNISKGDIILNGLDGDKYANTYMTAVKFSDIQDKLNGDVTASEDEEGNMRYETYNWRDQQEQTADNYYQLYKYDFRYPKTAIVQDVENGEEPSSSDLENYWTTGGNVTGISSRAFMVNIMQVLTDENLLYVTRDGFDESGNINESDYMEIKVSSSTKIVRYDAEEREFTPYAKGTESTALTIQDLKGANDYGTSCSKVLVTYVSGSTSSSSAVPTAKFIVIYE
ncbi:MAG: S-layer homology domain-containing protein [Oscillospiraceae bacterium]|nr:S-layer homology domain-containing protein [Oscillospiraceae bacterium]